LPPLSRKKTLPMVLGRFTALVLVAAGVVPVGEAEPGLPSGVFAWVETSFWTSLASTLYCVALLRAAPLASSQK
jgi:hypothetical protein